MEIEIGGRYRFAYPVEFRTLADYSAHRDQVVTVRRYLNEDPESSMFKVQADDGWIGDAFEDELVEAR